jgi:hypothetical protein
VAEVRLKRPCIVSSVGQCVAAGVPEHVRVCLEGQLGHLSGSFDHSGEAGVVKGAPRSEARRMVILAPALAAAAAGRLIRPRVWDAC